MSIYGSAPHSGSFSNIPFEGDTWWHVVVGNYILSTGHWPTTDIYAFTIHGAPWLAYEWVGEVVMAAASRVAGIEGLMWLLVIMSGVFVLLLYYYAYQRCRNAMAAFLACAALLPVVSHFFTLRPQMLGYTFLILTLIAMERFRQGHDRALWLLPGLFLIWVNTHSSIVFGALAMVAYWATGLRGFQFRFVRAEQWTPRQRLQLELITLLCLLASIITPYGSRLATYPMQMVLFGPENLMTNSEFFPLRLNTFTGSALLVLFLCFLAYVVLARPVFRAETAALFLFAGYEVLIHVRFVLLFVPIFTPFLAEAFNYFMPDRALKREGYIFNAALIFAALILIVEFFPPKQTIERAIANNFPVKAADYIAGHDVPGPMFNELSWGGYLTWALTPRHQVFIDSRDIYDYAGVMPDYIKIADGGQEAIYLLGKYSVRSCLISRDTRLASTLAASPDWREIFHGRVGAIFLKKGTR